MDCSDKQDYFLNKQLMNYTFEICANSALPSRGAHTVWNFVLRCPKGEPLLRGEKSDLPAS